MFPTKQISCVWSRARGHHALYIPLSACLATQPGTTARHVRMGGGGPSLPPSGQCPILVSKRRDAKRRTHERRGGGDGRSIVRTYGPSGGYTHVEKGRRGPSNSATWEGLLLWSVCIGTSFSFSLSQASRRFCCTDRGGALKGIH